MKRLEKRLDLGLSVLVSRRSRDLFFKGLGLVLVSGNLGGSRSRSRSRSRLGLKTKCIGLVSVSKPKVSFTSLGQVPYFSSIKACTIRFHQLAFSEALNFTKSKNYCIYLTEQACLLSV
jgi:hypothetical protein